MVTSTERLAQQIQALRTRLDGLARTPQLTNSSIDNGALQLVTSGQVSGIVGTQFDGTTGAVVVAGPKPPIPTAPTVTTVIGGIKVAWDGKFVDPQPTFTSPVVAPMDFARVDIEVSTDPTFPEVRLVHGSISSAAGGEVTISWTTAGTPLYVRLKTVSGAGKFSDLGLTTGPTPSGLITLGDLGFDIADYAGGTTIYYSPASSPPTAPTGGFTAGDLWLQDTGNVNTAGKPLYKTLRWDGARWVELQDQGISDSLAAAVAAQASATSATALANAAQATANGKITSFYQISAPTSGMSTGDFWLDTDDGNKLYRYNGTAWVVTQDAAIQSALTQAGTAQATADSKVRIYAQPTAPTGLTAADVGDEWVDTDGGNQVYVWGNTSTLQRTNLAPNPSFEYDAAGTLTAAPSGGYSTYSSGSPGTLTYSIQATGGTAGSKYAKVVSSSMAPTAELGLVLPVSVTAGATVRVSADFWVTVASTTKPVQMYVDWLTSAGALTGSGTRVTGTGNTGTQRLSSGLLTVPAGAVTLRVWLLRASSSTGANGLPVSSATTVNADLNLDAVLVDYNPPTGAPTTYFDGSAAYGVDTIWNGTPNLSTSTAWQESGAGSYGWQPRLIRTGAIQPQSLVASNIIATGTVSAALLEAVLVLATTVVAGDPNATHAAMKSDGFHVYDGAGNEVLRLGTTSNDYFGVVDSTGELVATIDDTGQGNLDALTVRNEPSFVGTPLSSLLGSASGGGNGSPFSSLAGAQHFYGYNYSVGSVTISPGSEIGLIEMSVTVDAGRMYHLIPEVSWHPNAAPCEIHVQVRDGGTSSPSVTSPIVFSRQFQGANLGWDVIATTQGLWQPTTSGTHRLLLTAVNSGASAGTLQVNTINCPPTLNVLDLGPAKQIVASVSTGGGTSAPPVQNFYVELAPAGIRTYSGDGTLRTDTSDVVQGWDPSGGNGDGKGHWWFTRPNITGTITRMDLYMYSNHTYFNSGGQALISPTQADVGGPGYSQPRSQWNPGATYPKPGGVTVTLPSDWYPFFTTAGSGGVICDGIRVGPSGGSNETFYIRFAGPDTRLRIWYTQ